MPSIFMHTAGRRKKLCLPRVGGVPVEVLTSSLDDHLPFTDARQQSQNTIFDERATIMEPPLFVSSSKKGEVPKTLAPARFLVACLVCLFLLVVGGALVLNLVGSHYNSKLLILLQRQVEDTALDRRARSLKSSPSPLPQSSPSPPSSSPDDSVPLEKLQACLENQTGEILGLMEFCPQLEPLRPLFLENKRALLRMVLDAASGE